MRYSVLNLGQAANIAQGQDVILTRDFDAFYEIAKNALQSVANIAQAGSPTSDEQNQISQALGQVMDYSIPTVPCPTCPTPAAAAPAVQNFGWAYALGGIAVGVVAGHFLL